MEVVRSYDIARLVLGYLRDSKLDAAARLFCKTSPYLVQENELVRKGFWPFSLRHDHLKDIITEFCEIQCEVVKFIDSLPEKEQSRFPKHGTLLAKISLLLKIAKENCAGRKDDDQKIKRRKTVSECPSFEATQEKDLPGFSPRLRRSFPQCSSSKKPRHYESTDEDTPGVRCAASHSSDSEASNKSPKPNRKATPADEDLVDTAPVPNFPAISAALLENAEFQNKLVENINKKLSSGPAPTPEKVVSEEKPDAEKPSDNIAVQFEEMIKSILDETEKDPRFDDLVESIVLSNNTSEVKPMKTNQATQYSPIQTTSGASSTPAPEVPAEAPLSEPTLKQRLRSRKSNVSVQPPKPKGSSKTSKANISVESVKANVSGDPPKDTNKNSQEPPPFTPSNCITNVADVKASSSFLDSDSLLGSTGSQLLGQLSDNLLIDMATGQTIPFLMSDDMNTIYLNTTSDPTCYSSVHVGSIIEAPDLGAVSILPPNIASISVPVNQKCVEASAVSVSIMPNNAPPTTTEIAVPGPSAPTLLISGASSVPVSLESKITDREKVTPGVGVASSALAKNLSTPRRRSSHVRVLNFTPPKGASDVQVTVKPSQPPPTELLEPESQAKPTEIPTAVVEPTEKPQDVKIIGEVITISNESSNSSSNNGFAKTTSDVTVIHQTISDTPRRKSEDRRSCVRVLSKQTSSETGGDVPQQKKSAIKRPSEAQTKSTKKRRKQDSTNEEQKPASPEVPSDPMQEWARMRSIAPGKWDQHLRAVCATEQAAKPPPPSTRKRRRKLRPFQRNKKAQAGHSPTEDQPEPAKIEPEKPSEEREAEPVQPSPGRQSAKKALIEFKISTPIKVGKSPAKQKSKVVDSPRDQPSVVFKQPAKCESPKPPSESVVQPAQCPSKAPERINPPEEVKLAQALLESRSNNIGLLLDTPYKLDAVGVPITPGFLIPDSNTTPMIRLTSFRGQISMCKNPDLPTPNYAITPGSGLTPFDKDTPRSGYYSNNPTDYSSGSSYYRPDESDDLDKQFDAMLAENRKKAREKSVFPLSSIPETQESREVSQEETSNQTVVTAINKPTEPREHIIKCHHVPENIASPAKLTASPHYTLSDGLSKDISNASGSTSSDSSSCSHSSSSDSECGDSAKSEDDDISWVEPGLNNASDATNNDTKGIVDDDGEVRYPIRNWITPKKAQNQTNLNSNSDKTDKKLADVVDKIKSKAVAQPMQTKRIESLEEKRLRIKEKLHKDFASMETKRACHVALVKPKGRLMTTHIRTKKVPIVQLQKPVEVPKPNRTKIELLTSLNLSHKNIEKSALTCRPTTPSDIVETDEFPKLQVDEDSKDSADAMEVRKAAFVLTNMMKGSANPMPPSTTSDSISLKKQNVEQSVETNAKGRRRNPKKAAPEPTEEKLDLPHKPVTRGATKNIKKQLKEDEQSKATDADRVSPEKKKSSQKEEIPEIIPEKETHEQKQNLREIEPTTTETCAQDTSLEFAAPAGSSSSDQEEDVDPYDACELDTIDENDKLRYLQITHNASKSNSATQPQMSSEEMKNLSSSIMNIYLNGAPHQIVVSDEIELFSNSPSVALVGKVTKATEEKSTAASKRKPKSVANRAKKVKSEESETDVPRQKNASVPHLQPKITIKYKQAASKKVVGNKLKTESVVSNKIQKKSPLKSVRETAASVESSKTDLTMTLNTTSDTQAPINTEDIFAVLSHIHGNEPAE
ncbi:unnamed protein product [Hermetia illucens]|uniref:LisH domain-containing protein n=1 Tax=Hermetia illucens TaxID=343691 RepID=A0A7R8V0N2_HERIL|nr:mucin-17 isoform X2 [Hermetia illucens]CAD7090473.1 unnamed protein product [Hermetia illucens]